jgi:pimeloyl-ACP methyl ester carboxylesterase
LDVLARARRVDVPLLVVRGEGEYAAFRPVQAALCAAVPGARLVDVPGLAHMLVTGQDVVDAEVTAWLA